MSAAARPGAVPRRGRWSLQRRLSLLIVGLVGAVIGALGAEAYREVHDAAVDGAVDHLARAGRELATASASTSAQRVVSLRAAASDPVVARAITAPAVAPADSASLVERLDESRPPADSSLVAWQLFSASGELRWTWGAVSAHDAAMLAPLRARMRRPMAFERSPLYGDAGRVHLWSVLPVVERGRVVGAFAELRRLVGSARTERTIQELIGSDVRLLYASAGTSEWASIRGEPAVSPFRIPPPIDRPELVEGTGGTRYYAVQSAIPDTPWRIVLFQSERAVLRRPREFLQRILAVGVLLLGAGALGAWLLGRHVARPLRRVTEAAEGLAAGDYDRRAPVEGAAELARLAHTFNTMAERLGEAHTELVERNAALQRANEAKARFLAVMSHELRTPLNAIGGHAELIEMGLHGPVTPAQADALSRIRRNKDHLLSIIADVLSFSRADAGHLTLSLRDLPVAEALADAAGALRPRFAAKGIRLELAPVPSTHVVRADREKLQQVVLNLLENALRFTKPGGDVRLSSARLDEDVRIDVRDTGIGIAPDALAQIFEPFVLADASLTRETGGVGLGLAVARNLVTAMGGSISAESTPGEGSTFSVTLPLGADELMPRPGLTTPRTVTAGPI